MKFTTFLTAAPSGTCSLIWMAASKTDMSRVGANIRFEQQLLEQQLGPDNTTLQWNEGGHFDHMDARTAQAYAWTLNKLHALRK